MTNPASAQRGRRPRLSSICRAEQLESRRLLTTLTFSNNSPTQIVDNSPGNPSPSPIAVSGVGFAPAKVTVELDNLSHTFPADVDMLLVGPTGANAIILSDVGGSNSINNVTLTLDDEAATSLPSS